uniref:Uncharacterized protein n=1 Tax=Oryza nivara TaxID=4536 RepID=A0A0E0GST4_ORYNI
MAARTMGKDLAVGGESWREYGSEAEAEAVGCRRRSHHIIECDDAEYWHHIKIERSTASGTYGKRGYMSEAASSKHVMENTGYEERELIPKHLAQKNK